MKRIICLALAFFIALTLVSAAFDWDIQTNAYFDFEEGSGTTLIDVATGELNGTISGSPAWVSGIVGNGLRFYGDDDWVDMENNLTDVESFGVSFWIYYYNSTINSRQITLNGDLVLTMKTDTTGELWISNNGWKSLEEPIEENIWTHYAFSYNGSNLTFYKNGSLIWSNSYIILAATDDNFLSSHEGTSNWINATVDELGFFNSTLSATNVTDLWNSGSGLARGAIPEVTAFSIDLIFPEDNYAISTIGENFTAHYNLTNVNYNLTNATYYVWNSTGSIFNDSVSVSLSGITNTTNEFINNFTLETYTWNVLSCYGNETVEFQNCTFADSNFTLVVGAGINNVHFENTTYETANETFQINITLLPGANLYLSEFVYNATVRTGTILDLGSDKYSLSRSRDIPIISGNSQNYSFYWRLTYEKDDGSFEYQNLSFGNQTVEGIVFVECNATYTTQFINFTTRDSMNPYPNISATFKSAWNYRLLESSGDIEKNYSYEEISELSSNWTFCMSPENKNFTVSSTIEYDSTGYAKNFYYLNNASLSNVTEILSLYLLNDTAATVTVLKVVDGGQNPIEDVFILIQSYDVGTDTYYTVGMARTNFVGEDIVYLNWYDTFYKFILIKDEKVIKITTPYKISSTPQTFTIITGATYEYDKFEDFIYSLTFNNATGNFVLTYIKPSGLVTSACLRVIKRNQTADYTVCENCDTSASGTIFCNINGYGNGTFIATFYATGSMKFIDSISELIGIASEVYDALGNLDATVLAIFFAGIVMAMFLITPVLGVIGMLLGMLGAAALGFQPIDYTAFIGISLVGGVVIWILWK